MENNNKESFKLLARTGSGSESNSEAPQFVVTPRRKRLKRRLRANHVVTRTQQSHRTCGCGGQTVSLVLAAVLLTCWLFSLSWMAIALHGELQRLDDMVQRVVAGSEGVPDDLQKIHSLSRALQQNQTQLALRVSSLVAQIDNITQELPVLQASVRANAKQLQSNPEPFNGKELVATVAQWGSQIKDLDNTVRSLKQQSASLEALTQLLSRNFTTIQETVSQLRNISLRPAPVEPNVAHMLDSLRQSLVQVAANITETNSTLGKRLQWLQDDQGKDHKAIEGLQEMGQNITARVKTLEGECAKSDVQTLLNTTITRLAEQLDQESLRLRFVEHNFSQLQGSSGTDQPAAPVIDKNLPEKDHIDVPSASASSIEDVPGSSPATFVDDKASPVPGG